MPSIYGLDFQTNQFFARSLARFAAQKARFTLLETREVDLYMWQVYDLWPYTVKQRKDCVNTSTTSVCPSMCRRYLFPRQFPYPLKYFGRVMLKKGE